MQYIILIHLSPHGSYAFVGLPFVVNVGARQRFDLALKLGTNTENVTVSGAADLLDTERSLGNDPVPGGGKPASQWSRIYRSCNASIRRAQVSAGAFPLHMVRVDGA